jgi:hypothetical protein
MSSAAAGTPAPATTGRRLHLIAVAVFMVLVLAQFYLAGRGVFGADTNFNAHKDVGGIAHLLSLLILIATIGIPDTRNRHDIGLAAALFVLMTIQASIATFKHPEIGAIHPFTALLVLGLGSHLLARDRAALAGG